MTYVIAAFLYFSMVIITRMFSKNLEHSDTAEEKATGCLSGICILCIIAIEIWLMAHGLMHLGLLI